jgi:hypothetical protein
MSKHYDLFRAGGYLRAAAMKYAEAVRNSAHPNVAQYDTLLADAAEDFAKAVAKTARGK